MALDKVAHLATKRTTLPALNCVKISSGASMLKVTATDLECFASTICHSEGELKPTLVSPKLLSRLPSGEEISLLSNSNGNLEVKGQSSKDSAILSTHPVIEFPDWPSCKNEKAIGVNCDDLAEAIEAVAWCADNTQEARPLCGAIHIQCTAKSIIAETANGSMLSRFDRPAIAADCELIINCEHWKTLVDALRQKDATVSVMDKWLCVTSEHFLVAIRRMEGQYFSTEKILSSPRRLIGLIESKMLRDYLATITSLGITVDWGCRTKLEFTGKTLAIEFVGKSNSFKTEVPFKCKSPTTLMVDASKTKKALDNTDGDELKLSVTDTGSLVFESGDVANFVQQLIQ